MLVSQLMKIVLSSSLLEKFSSDWTKCIRGQNPQVFLCLQRISHVNCSRSQESPFALWKCFWFAIVERKDWFIYNTELSTGHSSSHVGGCKWSFLLKFWFQHPASTWISEHCVKSPCLQQDPHGYQKSQNGSFNPLFIY